MTNDEIAKLPEMLTVEQARAIVNIGKSAMYCLIRENKDFPSVNLGARRTRVIKTEFLTWIKEKCKA
jgi:predicted DNA-binding transcriptional regulator AlpA